MFILWSMVIFFGLGCSTCAAFPTQCKKDGFFDPLKQMYLSCTECTVERQASCRECCPSSDQEPTDSSNHDPEKLNTVTEPSVLYNANRSKYHIVGLFFHILIIVMVAGTMSTIVCIGCKVAKDRRTAQCCADRDNHCINHDAAIIQEVFTARDATQQGNTHNYPSTSTTNLAASIPVKHLPGQDHAVL